MSKIYVNQTYLTLVANIGQDITGATVTIDYKKPSNKRGSFPATIVDALTGEVKYDITNANDIDEVGFWTFYANCTFANGKTACGEPHKEYIYKCGH